MTDLELLQRKLAKLESRFRWLARGGLVVLLVIIAGVAKAQNIRDRILTPGQSATAPPTIEAEVRSQHFVLVDGKGKERASLVADAAGSAFLVMFDAAGKTRVNLSVGNDGPSLVFYDNSGRQRTIIGSTSMVPSHVNDNGVVEKSPASSIILFDKGGKLLWREP